MPRYEYRCRTCRAVTAVVSAIADYDPDAKPVCVTCHEPMGQVFGVVPFTMDVGGHYNPSVGRYVRNKADLNSALSQASDEATARNGIPHKFVAHDIRDHEAFGADGEGLADTARRRHHKGGKPLNVPFDY